MKEADHPAGAQLVGAARREVVARPRARVDGRPCTLGERVLDLDDDDPREHSVVNPLFDDHLTHASAHTESLWLTRSSRRFSLPGAAGDEESAPAKGCTWRRRNHALCGCRCSCNNLDRCGEHGDPSQSERKAAHHRSSSHSVEMYGSPPKTTFDMNSQAAAISCWYTGMELPSPF